MEVVETWLVLEFWPSGIPHQSLGEFENRHEAMNYIVALCRDDLAEPNHYYGIARAFKSSDKKGGS